eukprot:15345644-Ditylum_brightwellii.AAC.1
MERTNNSSSTGKWFFIVNKANMTEAATFLDRAILVLYQCIVPNELRFDHVPIPHCTYTQMTQTVGFYANVLIGQVTVNPQEEEDTNLDKHLLRPCKHAAIAINTTTNDATKDTSSSVHTKTT